MKYLYHNNIILANKVMGIFREKYSISLIILDKPPEYNENHELIILEPFIINGDFISIAEIWADFLEREEE